MYSPEDDFSDVYGALIELLPHAAVPQHLASLPLKMNTARAAAADRSIWGNLRKRFSPERLVQAGVAEQCTSTRRYRFSAALRTAGAMCVGLADAEGNYYEIVTANGCLSGRELPLMAVMRDVNFLDDFEDNHEVYVGFSIYDFALLRAMGLPATTATGLASLHGPQLNQLVAMFGVFDDDEPPPSKSSAEILAEEDDDDQVSDPARPNDPLAWDPDEASPPPPPPTATSPTATSPPPTIEPPPPERTAGAEAQFPAVDELILVGWSIADWTADEPEELAPVMEHLRRLHADLNLGPFSTRVWRQTPSGLESLEFIIRHGSLKRFRGALERSSNQKNASPLFPHKQFSLSECLLKLIFPGSRTATVLGPDYRANAHAAIMHQCIEPLILELESTQVTALERNRKLIAIHRLVDLHRRLLNSFARAQKPEVEALLKQMTAEVSTLIDELDPPIQGAATKSSLKRRFTF